jgi:hypothetical protein
MIAGEAETDQILRQQDVRDPRPEVGLVPANPEQLRRGETWQGVVARDRDQPCATEHVADLVALGLCPLVVPQDRRTQDPILGVERDQPVHLTGEAHRLHLVAAHLVDRRPDRAHGRGPPHVRVLFAPALMRRLERILHRRRRSDGAGAIEDHRLRRGGGHIQA